jgi:CheY-like chemotaxis protein
VITDATINPVMRAAIRKLDWAHSPLGPMESLPQTENLPLVMERHGGHEQAYFTFSYSPIRDNDVVRGFICVVNETTAHVLRERETTERAESLAEVDRAKTQFFNSISHEFRTPLTLMLGPLDDLLRELRDPDQRRSAEMAAARILFADGNRDLREYVKRILSPFYAVVLARNGTEALSAVRETPFDLILSDIMMPETNGFELLQAIRADEATRSTPVIFLSARRRRIGDRRPATGRERLPRQTVLGAAIEGGQREALA